MKQAAKLTSCLTLWRRGATYQSVCWCSLRICASPMAGSSRAIGTTYLRCGLNPLIGPLSMVGSYYVAVVHQEIILGMLRTEENTNEARCGEARRVYSSSHLLQHSHPLRQQKRSQCSKIIGHNVFKPTVQLMLRFFCGLGKMHAFASSPHLFVLPGLT